MMPEALDRLYKDAAAWHCADLVKSDEWIYRLSETEVEDLETALAFAKANGTTIYDITQASFPLISFTAGLAEILREIETGRGFVLIRGLPIERYSEEDASIIFWGIGAYFGQPIAQNAQGDLLGHVRDQGRDWENDKSARGYQTTSGLPFHNDSGDVVGLLCFEPAKSGGLSCIVSSASIHNEILASRPDLSKILFEPFYVDARGEEPEGQAPYYIVPRFNFHKGRLYTQYGRVYVESAQRFPEVPRLTPEQVAALNLFDEVANSDHLRFDMDFQSGDMQFLSNHTVLHARTEYEDHKLFDSKRHLLRLWLFTLGFVDRPPAFARRYADIAAWQANPRGGTSALQGNTDRPTIE
jgi:hypothetical protein